MIGNIIKGAAVALVSFGISACSISSPSVDRPAISTQSVVDSFSTGYPLLRRGAYDISIHQPTIRISEDGKVINAGYTGYYGKNNSNYGSHTFLIKMSLESFGGGEAQISNLSIQRGDFEGVPNGFKEYIYNRSVEMIRSDITLKTSLPIEGVYHEKAKKHSAHFSSPSLGGPKRKRH